MIGIPDEDAGERPKAFIVISEAATEADVRAFVDGQVAHYKRLKEIAFVDSIPKSASGKILRRVLSDRERAGRGLPAQSSIGATATT